jgi:Domain of unknown function (DUF4234)
MSESTSQPAASATVLEAPPENGHSERSSIPSPVLPPQDGVIALSGTRVTPTPRSEAAPPAPPPPAWAMRAAEAGRAPAFPQQSQRPVRTSLGPAGKRRSPLLVSLLSVFTFGVYALVWHHRINREVRDFDPRMHVLPGRSTLAVAVPWALGVLVTLAAAARIGVAILNISLPFDPHVTVLQAYALLGALLLVPYAVLLLPFSAIAAAMTLERVRIAEDRVGVTTDSQLRPCALLCVMLVPVLGGLVVMAFAQHRLNRVWNIAPATEARITRL